MYAVDRRTYTPVLRVKKEEEVSTRDLTKYYRYVTRKSILCYVAYTRGIVIRRANRCSPFTKKYFTSELDRDTSNFYKSRDNLQASRDHRNSPYSNTAYS